MACNCIEKVTDKMADHFQKQNPEYNVFDAEFQKKGLSLKTGQYESYNEIKIRYNFTKKDGSISSTKTEIRDAYGEYCQFCGKKHKEESEVAND
jgi:hypothetical protein